MKKISVIFNGKEYNCIQKDKTLFLLFDKVEDNPRGNGWCLIKHDSCEQKCLIRKSNDNRLVYNNDCVMYNIIFSCNLNSDCDNYVVEFYSDLFNKLFIRFGRNRSFNLTIANKSYDVILGKKNEKSFGSLGVMVFKCNTIEESELLNLYYFVSSFIKFISIDTCSHPSSFFVNGTECFSEKSRFYDWMQIDFLHINHMKCDELRLLAQYIADNSQFLSNLFFSNKDYISTKDIGSLYSIIDKTLDDSESRKYNKKLDEKRNVIKYNDILLLIKNFGEDNKLSNRKEFRDFYSGANRYGFSIKEKIEYVLDDYLTVFKDDDGISLNIKDDLYDFAKAINSVRTFDAHGDGVKSNVVSLGLYYSAFLQELAYYSIFRFSFPCSIQTIKKIFSSCYSFVSVNSNIWMRNKIKQ